MYGNRVPPIKTPTKTPERQPGMKLGEVRAPSMADPISKPARPNKPAPTRRGTINEIKLIALPPNSLYAGAMSLVSYWHTHACIAASNEQTQLTRI